jgi:hypothetical protein
MSTRTQLALRSPWCRSELRPYRQDEGQRQNDDRPRIDAYAEASGDRGEPIAQRQANQRLGNIACKATRGQQQRSKSLSRSGIVRLEEGQVEGPTRTTRA